MVLTHSNPRCKVAKLIAERTTTKGARIVLVKRLLATAMMLGYDVKARQSLSSIPHDTRKTDACHHHHALLT